MFVISNDRQLFEIFKEKCLQHQTFKRMDRRKKITLIKDGRVQYVYYIGGKPKYHKESGNRVAVIAKAIKKAYNEYIVKNNFHIDIPEKRSTVRGKNSKLFDSLEIGTKFYQVDISRAYLQIAWKMGMVSDKLYRKYINDKGSKRLLNMAFAFVLSPKICEYVVNGRYMCTISEDTSLYNDVYRKIRHTCYNSIHFIRKGLGEQWIDFNIDGITFLPESLEKVKELMKELDYTYSIENCEKISDNEYVLDDEVKTFRMVSPCNVQNVNQFTNVNN